MNEHPAHYFVRYLLVSQEDISAESIDSTLNLHGMAPVDPKCLQIIRAEVGDIPADFRPWDRTHRPTNRWLRRQKIYSLIHPDEATKEMTQKILNNPRLRRDVEGLLLGNVSFREASYRLRKLGKTIGDVAIAEYAHYFWNTSILGIEDWARYFVSDEGENGTHRTSVNQTLYNAALHAGPEVAMYRVGVRRELDGKVILLEVQAELYHTFKEVSSLPISMEKVKMLSATARGLARIDERIQAGDEALHDVLKKFEKFRVLTDGGTVPSLIELAPTGSITDKSRNEILTTRDN